MSGRELMTSWDELSPTDCIVVFSTGRTNGFHTSHKRTASLRASF